MRHSAAPRSTWPGHRHERRATPAVRLRAAERLTGQRRVEELQVLTAAGYEVAADSDHNIARLAPEG
ncbi:hypothetical protein [Nonomuraea guangzhouensis]|uniref:Uncharacterized protein n=1 Tax=Nonomuraea guangzhouensis TaxID=1291555 RepID=A0ABW4GTV5_9ACTN|nr:hypothetical protein [Nonomuraea guangzhouensis]